MEIFAFFCVLFSKRLKNVGGNGDVLLFSIFTRKMALWYFRVVGVLISPLRSLSFGSCETFCGSRRLTVQSKLRSRKRSNENKNIKILQTTNKRYSEEEKLAFDNNASVTQVSRFSFGAFSNEVPASGL